MKTIGATIKQVRKIRKLSIKELSEKTKIRETFIRDIEHEKWARLPEYPVVLGFIKSISNALEINTKNVVALLRRDYPPQKLIINPKPDPKPEFRWNPKLTFFTGVGIVLAVVIGYLVFQYSQFVRPPALDVIRPTEGQVVSGQSLEVSGTTDPNATVTVNDQPAYVDDSGHFYTELEISDQTSNIVVAAKSRSGKESREVRKINVTL